MSASTVTHLQETPHYVDAVALAEMFDVSVPTIRRWAQAGTIPPPIRLGSRVVRWDLAAVQRALQPVTP